MKPGKTKMMIDPSKVRCEREKWGNKEEEDHRSNQLPGGFYLDGKKSLTLVRDTVVTKVMVHGGRGKGAYKVVKTVSNKLKVEDHYPIISYGDPNNPDGEYITHVTPRESRGKDIAAEVVSVVRERGVKLRVIGMDGCSTNCGIHRGVFRCVEVGLDEACQHVVCLIHHIELYFRRHFDTVDGVTLDPTN